MWRSFGRTRRRAVAHRAGRVAGSAIARWPGRSLTRRIRRALAIRRTPCIRRTWRIIMVRRIRRTRYIRWTRRITRSGLDRRSRIGRRLHRLGRLVRRMFHIPSRLIPFALHNFLFDHFCLFSRMHRRTTHEVPDPARAQHPSPSRAVLRYIPIHARNRPTRTVRTGSSKINSTNQSEL